MKAVLASVLVVDDEPQIRRFLRTSLDVHGYGVDEAQTARDAIQLFASTKPDGFGIGAFEARSLVIAMGGRLSVDSRLGCGTTFLSCRVDCGG